MATNEAYYELEHAVIKAIRDLPSNPSAVTIDALCCAVRYDLETDAVRQIAYRLGIVEREAA